MKRYSVIVLLVLGMAAVLCGTVSAAGMGIVAETHETSGVDAPSCPSGCDCMSETAAIQRWGVNGYETCGKTICGQSADAMVQYYCIHQLGSPAPADTLAPPKAQPPLTAAQPAAPAAAAPTQKSPAGTVTVIAALGAALAAAAVMRKE